MKNFKNLFALLLVFALALSLAACSSSSSSSRRSRRDDDDDETTSQAVGEYWGVEWEDDALAAIAFIGYSNDIFADDIQSEVYRYDEACGNFLGGDYTAVETEGDEIYLVIVRYADTEIIVEEYNDGEVGEEIHASDAYWHLLLRCGSGAANGDVDPNTLITIRSSMGTYSFGPSLGPADGGVILGFEGYLQDLSSVLGNSGNPYADTLIGDWRLTDTTTSPGYTLVFDWFIYADGTVTYITGYLNSEVIEHFEGTWYLPEGNAYHYNTFIFDMQLVYADYLDGGTPEGTLSGAYEFTADDPDRTTFTYLHGDPLTYADPAPDSYEFFRMAGGGVG